LTEPEGQRRVFAVINPRGGQSDPPAVRQALGRNLPAPTWECVIHESAEDGDMTPAVREAVRAGFSLVVAAGGDGTVSAVANGLVGTGVPLAILPVGTGNSLARELGVPLNLDRACALIAGEHQVRVVDVMAIGDRYCCLNVSAGLTAVAMRDTTGQSKHRYGLLAYVVTIVRSLAGLQPCRYELEVDSKRVTARASDVLIVNGTTPVAALVRTGPSLQLDDGILGVYIIRARSLLDYGALAWSMLWGIESRDRRVRIFEARESIALDARPPAVVQADGDAIGHTPVSIKLVTKALHVIVPPPSAPPLGEAGALIERVVRQGSLRLGGQP